MEWQRYEYKVSTDPKLLQMNVVHDFLRQMYWSKDVTDELVQRAVDGSLCFGLYLDERQIGLARVVTDKATFAYMADAFVLEEFQGKGLGQWLLGCVVAHPDLEGLRRFLVLTPNAHDLYHKYGFQPLAHPEQMLEIFNPDIYRDAPQTI